MARVVPALNEAAESAPAIGPAERFTMAHVPTTGMWLIERLSRRWPAISKEVFAGKLRTWLNTASYCIVKTDSCVAGGMFWPEELEPQPSVKLLFLFSDLVGGAAEPHAHRVVRALEAWGRSQRCGRLIIDPRDCDVPPGVIRDRLGAQLGQVLWRNLVEKP